VLRQNNSFSEMSFKCENFQRTGAFKFRGAYNALAQLSLAQKQTGVITYSSGNHAQAIALAGQLLNIPTTSLLWRWWITFRVCDRNHK
jgi:threo-3-hydroxy-L-aspartate ammonia-lyase